MHRKINITFFIVCLIFLFIFNLKAYGLQNKGEIITDQKDSITINENIGDAMLREAHQVSKEFKQQTLSIFERTPLGWNLDTIDFLSEWIISLPLKIPLFMKQVMEQSRMLGAAGTLIMLIFITAVLYSLLGQKRVLKYIEIQVQPIREKVPEFFYPYFYSIVRVMVASLIPLILLGIFSTINAFIDYKTSWFQLLGRLLWLWTVGALFASLLRGSLLGDFFSAAVLHGKTIYQFTRLVFFYILAGIAILWGAEAFQMPQEVLAFLRFAISLSIICVLFLLFLKKNALLSLLPQLPYKNYISFLRVLDKYYFPFILLTFLAGLLWCIGYKEFGPFFLKKTWAVAGSYVVIMIVYHIIFCGLQKWSKKKEVENKEAQFFFKSLKSLLLYTTATTIILTAFALLGLFDLFQRIFSFPIFKIGDTSLSILIFIKAGLILLVFIYLSRLLQAYLDYRIYPSLGIDTGLAYALNTFFKYLIIVIGFLISLRIVGIDLRVLMVFAGTIGIGVGFGLQTLASNMISGLCIIFGGNLRKGDWIQAGDTIGIVTDIYLRASKVRTRDNIEYLIPNSDFISSTIVNYTLSSPMVRINIPIGVSYDADPEEVKEILLKSASKHSFVTNYKNPEVRFVEYGDNSINFHLLVWIDIRKIAERRIKSSIYFTVFKVLKKANIEIPFPQRDIHIRSGLKEPG